MSILNFNVYPEQAIAPTAARRQSPFHGIEPVREIAAEKWHPKPLAKKIDAFNVEARSAQTARERFESDQDAAQETDLRTVNLDNGLSRATKANFVTLLQNELRLRDTVAALAGEIYEARLAAVEKLSDLYQKAEKELIEKLLSIGYLPRPDDGIPVPGCWIPDFLHRHPGVRQAKETYEALRYSLGQNDALVTNEQAIDRIETVLCKIRERALGV